MPIIASSSSFRSTTNRSRTICIRPFRIGRPAALETIKAVHNLPELATRPYTLSLIAESLPQLERWQLEGRRVTGVDLYRHMVLSWLERDSGKHEFDIDHKLQIMEYMAAELWRTTGRTWTARQMEDWLARFMERTRRSPCITVARTSML